MRQGLLVLKTRPSFDFMQFDKTFKTEYFQKFSLEKRKKNGFIKQIEYEIDKLSPLWTTGQDTRFLHRAT